MNTSPDQTDEFTFSCPGCAQHITAPQSFRGQAVNCPSCSELFVVPLADSSGGAGQRSVTKKNLPTARHQAAAPREIMTNVKQGAIIGGWACFGLGIICMLLSLFTFFLYVPFFLVAFILSIVAMSQRRVTQGIMLLITTLIVPPIFGAFLTASRVADKLAKSSEKSEVEDVGSTTNGTTDEKETTGKGAGTKSNSLLDKLDQKNGFQDFQLGAPLSQFSGLKPAATFFKPDGDEKKYDVENFNLKLGDFEISRILLTFEMEILKEITIYADGKQNISGLKETLVQGYGQPERVGWMSDSVVWTGKKVVLRLNNHSTDDSGWATFTSKEVEAQIKNETNRKAKEGASAASKEL